MIVYVMLDFGKCIADASGDSHTQLFFCIALAELFYRYN
tara:strand:+ start:1455 stop:1571 length:117 start_codon:yes stop_codon:yes gene_type:complete